MSQPERARVLVVDDEALLMEALALHLRRDYQVHTALSGDEGLQKLKEIDGTAVVVSDMRMPGMDGATFLKHVMRSYPDTSRILLTGDPGRAAAVLAVNEGHVFRLLAKPCPAQQLKVAIDAGIIQFNLIRAERALLQETLIGCMEAMIDLLAITNPVAFGRTGRIKREVTQFADSLGCRGFWQLEAAAMLSQLGYLSLPAELVEKVYYAERLTAEEQALVDGVPAVTSRLLGHIPRLQPVLQILSAIRGDEHALKALGEGTVGLDARILLLVLDHDALIAQGHTSDFAMQSLRATAARYGEGLVEKFALLHGASSARAEIREIPLRIVQPGMMIMNDLRTHTKTLLVPRGFEVSESFLERLHHLDAAILAEKVKVLVPAGK